VAALVTDYNLNRQQAIDVLEVCIQLHVDTPDTPNWHLKHHQGLEYLNSLIIPLSLRDLPAITMFLNAFMIISILIFSLSIEQARPLMKKQFFTESKRD